ncbi:MAG: HEPN domain-containing protein [Pseudorhodobacter sp.]
MAELNLSAVDEVIKARKTLHGGGKGKPRKLTDKDLEGAALNRATVVFLSATLQAFVGEIFMECSKKAFGHEFTDKKIDNYLATWRNWGNPSPSNIVTLFRRLGIDDVLDGLSWKAQSNAKLRSNLDALNQIRNKIAHGQELKLNGKPFSLQFNQVVRWRNICKSFSENFREHALGRIK